MSTRRLNPVVDSHLHFWDAATYYRLHGDWLDSRPALQVSFLPSDLKPLFDACGVDKGLIVEAGKESHDLNLWWLDLARENDWICGVVAGISLNHPFWDAWLNAYVQSPYLAGVRAQLPGRPDTWPQHPDVERFMLALVRHRLTLDLLVADNSLSDVAALARHYPAVPIVVNHCGLPPFRTGLFDQWENGLQSLRPHPQVYVKYSPSFHDPYPELSASFAERMEPVVTILLETFGTDRLLWGSNWPVEARGEAYIQLYVMMRELVSDLSEVEQQHLFSGTARKAYGLT